MYGILNSKHFLARSAGGAILCSVYDSGILPSRCPKANEAQKPSPALPPTSYILISHICDSNLMINARKRVLTDPDDTVFNESPS